MNERRNDLEIVKGRAFACTIQLGSISSLRCQKSRKARVRDGRRALRSDVFADDLVTGLSTARLFPLWLRHA